MKRLDTGAGQRGRPDGHAAVLQLAPRRENALGAAADHRVRADPVAHDAKAVLEVVEVRRAAEDDRQIGRRAAEAERGSAGRLGEGVDAGVVDGEAGGDAGAHLVNVGSPASPRAEREPQSGRDGGRVCT